MSSDRIRCWIQTLVPRGGPESRESLLDQVSGGAVLSRSGEEIARRHWSWISWLIRTGLSEAVKCVCVRRPLHVEF